MMKEEYVNIPTPLTHPNTLDNCHWGEHLIGDEIKTSVMEAYNKIVKWKRNLFKVPSGKAGKSFIEEMSNIIFF